MFLENSLLFREWEIHIPKIYFRYNTAILSMFGVVNISGVSYHVSNRGAHAHHTNFNKITVPENGFTVVYDSLRDCCTRGSFLWSNLT